MLESECSDACCQGNISLIRSCVLFVLHKKDLKVQGKGHTAVLFRALYVLVT